MPTNMQDKECKQQQWLKYPRITDLVLQINIHAFFLCTDLLKIQEKVDLKMGEDSRRKPGKTKISSCLSLEDEKWEFILSLTQRRHCKEQRWQGGLSKIHKTFHIYFLYHHCNSKKNNKNKKKGIPLFLVLRRGYVRQGREEGIFPRNMLCIQFCALSDLVASQFSRPNPIQSTCLSFLHSEAYFKRSMSSCVRPRLSSCMVWREVRWGKALSSFSQHSSSRLGTASQILNREPVLLFS